MSTSSIETLNDDILLSIFDTVTKTFPLDDVLLKDRPITVTRAASQVCHRWRELMLDSSWIWGRVIDLVGCGRNHTKWMEEVARRSGSAPLWIYAGIGFNPCQTQYFLQRLESWERVEKLSAEFIIYLDDSKKIVDHLRIRFLSPAPILKVFDVTVNGCTLFLDTVPPGSSKRIFADYAPSLQIIRGNTGTVFSKAVFRLDSPWLSNIREIYPFPWYLTLDNIFTILQRTPIIESIKIIECNVLLVEPPPFTLALPKLSTIFLTASLPAVAAILDHITPGKLSSFYTCVVDCQLASLDLPWILSAFRNNLPSRISNYFTANSPTILYLEFKPQSLKVSDITTGIRKFNYPPQYFQVSISNIEEHGRWHDLVACILDGLTSSSTIPQGTPSVFQSITKLRIFVELDLRHPSASSLIAKLYSVLSLLPNVQEIHTNGSCAHTLVEVSSPDVAGNASQSVLFPLLHTLHLGPYAPLQVTDRVIYKDLTKFLTWRKKIGFSVAKLDLTRCDRSVYAHDLRELEGVDGLEVVWKKQGDEGRKEMCSYICGTGEPECLNILISDYNECYLYQ